MKTEHSNLYTVYIYTHIARGMGIESQLPDILAYFQHSCPAHHILCMQFSFNLSDIHLMMSCCITGCFHTLAEMFDELFKLKFYV